MYLVHSRSLLVAIAAVLALSASSRADDMQMQKKGAMTNGGMHQSDMQKKGPNGGHMGHMSMPMDNSPAHFAPTREAYTKNHDFLVKLVGLPDPIPYQKHFTLKFAVFDGHNPHKALSDATLSLVAGMRHGMSGGFAHGMNSTPKAESEKGDIAVWGMYFHMMGKWTLKVTVNEGRRQGVAYFDLPCCGS